MNLHNDPEFLKKFKTPLLLVAIFLIGFSIVYISHGPRLADPDAWHYFRYVNWILEEGGVPEIDHLQYYPTGGNPKTDNLVSSYMIAYGYKLFEPLGMSLMEYLMIAPAIFGGGLAAVALYLAVKELFGKKVGLLAALLHSFIPLSLTRIYAGTIDKEIVYGFFVYLTVYLFLRSYKEGIYFSRPSSFILPVLGGIVYGIGHTSWSGVSYIILVISLTGAIYFLYNKDENLMKAIFIIAVTAPLVMYLIQPYKYNLNFFIANFVSIVPITVSSLGLLYSMGPRIAKEKFGREISPLQVTIGGVITAVLLIIAAGEMAFINSMIFNAQVFLNMERGAQADLYMATVAESQPSIFLGGGDTILQRIMNGHFYPNLKLMLFVVPFGLGILFLKLKENKNNFAYLFAAVWVITGFFAANQGHRYLFFLAPSAVTVTAFTFFHLIENSKRTERKLSASLKSSMKPKMKERAERKVSNAKTIHLAAIILTLLVTFSTLDSAVALMSQRRSDLPAPWLDATLWMKDNTPENSVIMFWWDYGYYFQALGERATVADGGGNVPVNKKLAHMFTSPEGEAMKVIDEFVNYTEVPTYMLVSYEEFGKSSAINHIAQDDLLIGSHDIPSTGNPAQDEQAISDFLAQTGITSYRIVNFGNSYRIWFLADNGKPEMKDKLLAKLLPFNTGHGQGLEHFELVYSKYEYIWIYRIK